MSEIIIMPWGGTDWASQGRFVGNTDLPLNAAGREAVGRLAETFAVEKPDAIQVGPEEAARESAAMITKRLNQRAKRANNDLHELNLGIWAGLTEDDIRQRFTSAHDQWRESPETFCPPEGEPVADAAVRLRDAVQRALKRHKDKRVLFVIGPMAAALLWSTLEEGSLARFWEYYDANAALIRISWPRPMPPVTPESLVAGRTRAP